MRTVHPSIFIRACLKKKTPGLFAGLSSDRPGLCDMYLMYDLCMTMYCLCMPNVSYAELNAGLCIHTLGPVWHSSEMVAMLGTGVVRGTGFGLQEFLASLVLASGP